MESLKDEIRTEPIKLTFLLYRLFNIINSVLWIPKGKFLAESVEPVRLLYSVPLL
jgi:hypothetical protein